MPLTVSEWYAPINLTDIPGVVVDSHAFYDENHRVALVPAVEYASVADIPTCPILAPIPEATTAYVPVPQFPWTGEEEDFTMAFNAYGEPTLRGSESGGSTPMKTPRESQETPPTSAREWFELPTDGVVDSQDPPSRNDMQLRQKQNLVLMRDIDHSSQRYLLLKKENSDISSKLIEIGRDPSGKASDLSQRQITVEEIRKWRELRDSKLLVLTSIDRDSPFGKKIVDDITDLDIKIDAAMLLLKECDDGLIPKSTSETTTNVKIEKYSSHKPSNDSMYISSEEEDVENISGTAKNDSYTEPIKLSPKRSLSPLESFRTSRVPLPLPPPPPPLDRESLAEGLHRKIDARIEVVKDTFKDVGNRLSNIKSLFSLWDDPNLGTIGIGSLSPSVRLFENNLNANDDDGMDTPKRVLYFSSSRRSRGTTPQNRHRSHDASPTHGLLGESEKAVAARPRSDSGESVKSGAVEMSRSGMATSAAATPRSRKPRFKAVPI